jgi:fido (protein-threonine AMPylation protein)
MESRNEEADKSEARIAQLLNADTILFRTIALSCIHWLLFSDVFGFSGEFRYCDIAKTNVSREKKY